MPDRTLFVHATTRPRSNPDGDGHTWRHVMSLSEVHQWMVGIRIQELLIIGFSIVLTSFFLESDSHTDTGGVPNSTYGAAR
jgi:hypothetical protein